jgi:pyruvate,water dikinase
MYNNLNWLKWRREELKFIRWFSEISIADVPLVGGKNASLGEMYHELASKGVKIPNGFTMTAVAYRHLLDHSRIEEKIRENLSGLDKSNAEQLAERGRRIRDLICHAPFPQDLEEEVTAAYEELCQQYGPDTDVAVRSSATAEDLPNASFAGQQETYLNIRGSTNLIDATRRCFASLFTNRAISYREDMSFDHFQVALSIGVQKMVRSDLASSGVMFSIDTETGFPDVVFITAAYGLGENVVQGAVDPDEFYVFKPTLKRGFRSIIRKRVGEKKLKMIYSTTSKYPTKNVTVPKELRKGFALSDTEILELAKYAMIIEDHYSQKAGAFRPMDIEWAKDGITGELFVVQARPETVQSQKRRDTIEMYTLLERDEVLASGRSIGEKISVGKTHVIKEVKDITRFRPGEILVTDMTDPDWEPIMKTAAGVVTNRGGRTCHAAIISRELGIPAVVGTQNATERVGDGIDATLSCAEGDTGYIFAGHLKYQIDTVSLGGLKRPKTKIMMNVGNPEEAFALSSIPNDGVGLARLEFIINSYIKIHPLALVHFDKIKDKKVLEEIEEITSGYEDKPGFFVDKLAEGVGTIAAAFYPKDVIVRLSDFKSNEYANLIGGREFEPNEDNPMLGFRGASRYYSERYREGFALECAATKKVREGMGLANVKLMIPFVRTVDEGKKVIAEMERHGLKRGDNELEVYVMCEIPSNVILVDEFSQIFDGFSIGSNDLTQLTLGVDRDSELVAPIFDERNAAIKKMVSMAIEGAKRNGRHVGICGQAPSDYPEFAQFLVQEGIDSVSLNPDSVMKTTLKILEMERGEEEI